MLPVLDLDPLIASTAAVGAVALLEDRPPTPSGTLAEQVQTDLALLKWRQVVAIHEPCERSRNVDN